MIEQEILFIDDTPAARSSYSQELEDLFGDEVSVSPLAPSATLGEMLEEILGHSGLASLVIDERLNDTGRADYTGIALSEVVRARYQKLPIYILTNHPADIIDGGFNVEYIFDKNELNNPDYKKMVSARIRRSLHVFNDIKDVREERFELLLRHQLSGEITDDEKTELEKLQLSRVKPFSDEFIDNSEALAKLEAHKAELDKINIELKKRS